MASVSLFKFVVRSGLLTKGRQPEHFAGMKMKTVRFGLYGAIALGCALYSIYHLGYSRGDRESIESMTAQLIMIQTENAKLSPESREFVNREMNYWWVGKDMARGKPLIYRGNQATWMKQQAAWVKSHTGAGQNVVELRPSHDKNVLPEAVSFVR